MLIKRKRGWEISESRVAPESVFLNRRNLLIGGGATLAAAAVAGCSEGQPAAPATPRTVTLGSAAPPPAAEAARSLYPAVQNAKYMVDRPVTPEAITSTYNNFYEYGEDKSVYRKAGQLKTRPWEIKVDGLVEKPFTIA